MTSRRSTAAIAATAAVVVVAIAVLLAMTRFDDGETDEASAAFPDEGTYVGYVEGSEIAVAVSVSDRTARAYLCDDENISVWLQGPLTRDRLTLTSEGGATLVASVDGDLLSGHVVLDGQERTYTAALAEAPAGLFEARDTTEGGVPVHAGWIVQPDGRSVGLMSFASFDEPVSPPPLPEEIVGTIAQEDTGEKPQDKDGENEFNCEGLGGKEWEDCFLDWCRDLPPTPPDVPPRDCLDGAEFHPPVVIVDTDDDEGESEAQVAGVLEVQRVSGALRQ